MDVIVCSMDNTMQELMKMFYYHSNNIDRNGRKSGTTISHNNPIKISSAS